MTAQPKALDETKGNRRRKRGGQPGSTNAFRLKRPRDASAQRRMHGGAAKHGFYTQNFSPAERRSLEATKEIILATEIAMLRVLIRRSS
jgi:hypothetical protein